MDLSVNWLGMRLPHPLVPSAAQPFSRDIDTLLRLEDAGAAAVILHSLFEEQVRAEEEELERFLDHGTDSFAEVHLCGALLKHGPDHLGVIRDAMALWLEQHEYGSLADAQGILCRETTPDPSAFERANYMKAIHSW